ncbi:DNA repair exonuclease [Mesorhizobium sp. M4A.F.Ca.ET.050.02.1.1]|uniref:metallophosphoesterase family protein n=1 Tax=Mesorhizobium sp. M4A.F.Ca.ET.050.02.1.1 TaxID=2496754 RepID=UPI000FCA1813|nr:DNA repair exonuclease [Mesorhizobium sp. M4A.F.Ca.ET.050.02.1.1]RUX46075.1 DNA repair exonuclease [Mesorhizobium sp. M4A.F.Ca.ET.050.02.1.1]
MAFRFIHTADIHLDSPLRSLALRNPELAELVGDASRQAFVAVVDLCLAERVDALVIAGDLYDGEQTSMKTARFLASQMTRLHQAGVTVYLIRGNHDSMSRITKQLVLPDTVTIFGGRCQSVIQSGTAIDVAFHGLSLANPKAPESLLPKYAAPQEGAANVGIMHTSLAGSPGHDVYAPCSVADLHSHGFDYWALGHVHLRQVYLGASTLVMPGIPQGRDINEAGEKSVTLVTIRDDRSVEIEERLTSVAQFERVGVDLTGTSEWSEAVIRIRAGLEQAREEARSRYLVARLGLVGTSALSWSLMRDRDLAVAEAEQAAEQVGDTWVERLDLDLSAPVLRDSGNVADPTLELAESMRANAGSEAFRAEAREFVLKTIADLPPDARGFAGKDEAGLERFLDDVLAGSVDLVTARLKAGATR